MLHKILVMSLMLLTSVSYADTPKYKFGDKVLVTSFILTRSHFFKCESSGKVIDYYGTRPYLTAYYVYVVKLDDCLNGSKNEEFIESELKGKL